MDCRAAPEFQIKGSVRFPAVVFIDSSPRADAAISSMSHALSQSQSSKKSLACNSSRELTQVSRRALSSAAWRTRS